MFVLIRARESKAVGGRRVREGERQNETEGERAKMRK